MNTTRRGFMQQSAALGASTAAPWLASLAAIGEASAQTLPNDYKALVCVFLFGGNDHANTMIPVDIPANQLTKPLADNVLKPGYDNYIKYRREIAYQWADNKLGVNPPGLDPVPSVDLIPDTKRSSVPGALSMDVVKNLVVSGTNLPAGRNFAFSPPLTEMKQQFDAGKLAVLLNVGPLVEPTIGYRSPVDGTFYYLGCKADGTADATFNTNGSVSTARQALLPPRLGSHNDQQLVWQAFKPEGAANGWGGKIADQMGGSQGNRVFSCISVAGNNVYLTGDLTLPYQVTASNTMSVPLGSLRTSVYGSAASANVLGQIITGQGLGTTSQSLLEKDLTAVVRRSIAADDVLRNMPRMDGDGTYTNLNVICDPNNGIDLARQLRTVAHLIKNRDKLGATTGRQVFFVQLFTFDTHSNQNAEHPWLLRQLSLSLDAFMKDITAMGMANQVTAFTASDFGRTFNSNGDGTDHGWGGHHFVLGGAVNGGQFYGKAPTFVPDGPSAAGPNYRDEDNGRGRLIPSTSVVQYAATLASWMGVLDSQLPSVLPNVTSFNITGWNMKLGFMR